MSAPRQVALFGGSFNPPHAGHLGVAEWVLAHHPGELWLLPAWDHPFGKALAPFETRVRLCELLLADLGERRGDEVGRRARVSTAERDVGTGFTVDVIRHLQEERPGCSFRIVLGSDLVAERANWKRFDEVEALAPPIWIPRRGFPEANARLGLDAFLVEVSSTELRERLREGRDPGELLSPRVAAYVAEHGLYRRKQEDAS